MRRFILRSFLFTLPFFIVLFVEIFVLPIDFFTFRVWESIVVHRLKKILPGPFYPNMHLTKIEEGDLAHHTPYAVKKEVHWVTDRYGFRKRDINNRFYPIVVIGDSNIAGASLSQEETLSEVLESHLGIGVYPYAPAGMNSFLKERRFEVYPPDLVIYARVERELFELSPLKQKNEVPWVKKLKFDLRHFRPLQDFFVILDRISKGNMVHYLRANLRRLFLDAQNPIHGIDSNHGRVFFLDYSRSPRKISDANIQEIAQRIRSYRDAIARRGSRFIFLPIPDKENLFHELLQRPKSPFLDLLINELNRMNIETIPTQIAFEEAYKKRGLLLYHLDDTHWNYNGVKIAAELIKQRIDPIRKGGQKLETARGGKKG